MEIKTTTTDHFVPTKLPTARRDNLLYYQGFGEAGTHMFMVGANW